MNRRIVAGLALAFSLLAPVFSAEPDFQAGDLRVQVQGKGRAVILIPGLAGGPWVWEDTAAKLRDQYEVFIVTLPGFDTHPARPGVTFDSLQRDLRQLIRSRQLTKPVLVGHSLGGALALSYATAHSDSIGGVISVDGLPVFPGTEQAPDRAALAAGMRGQFASQSREQFLSGMQAYMRQIGTVDESKALELGALAARSDIGATGELAGELMALDLRSRLTTVSVPVVVVSPFYAPDLARMGIDEAGKARYYQGLMAGVEKLDVVSIAPARHFVMFDQPEKFQQALDRALASMFESRTK